MRPGTQSTQVVSPRPGAVEPQTRRRQHQLAGDDEPVAGVELIEPEQVAVALVPRARVQVVRQTARARPRPPLPAKSASPEMFARTSGSRYRSGRRQYAAMKPSSQSWGTGHDLDAVGAERSGDRLDRGDPLVVVLTVTGQ